MKLAIVAMVLLALLGAFGAIKGSDREFRQEFILLTMTNGAPVYVRKDAVLDFGGIVQPNSGEKCYLHESNGGTLFVTETPDEVAKLMGVK